MTEIYVWGYGVKNITDSTVILEEGTYTDYTNAVKIEIAKDTVIQLIAGPEKSE